MSITATSQAQNIYNTYTFLSSDTYKENAIDPSTVSKETYNVSNLSNAIDVLNDADSVNFYSIGNISSYVNNAFNISQLDCYNKLSNSSSITRLLLSNAGTDDIYDLIEYSNTLTTEEIASLAGIDISESTRYSNYVSESGSVLNSLA